MNVKINILDILSEIKFGVFVNFWWICAHELLLKGKCLWLKVREEDIYGESFCSKYAWEWGDFVNCILWNMSNGNIGSYWLFWIRPCIFDNSVVEFVIYYFNSLSVWSLILVKLFK